MKEKTAAPGGAFTRGQCLDFIAAANRDRIYPLVTCRMRYKGRIDPARLMEAVCLSSQVVPEILYSYDYARGGFVDRGLGAGDAVRTDTLQFEEGWKWDLGESTQLKIRICEGELIVGASHILCDGAGFLQYLYLLAALYNGAKPEGMGPNHRDIAPLLGASRARPRAGRGRGDRGAPALPFEAGGPMASPRCLTARIGPEDMAAIRRRAKDAGATLNDVFLAAYARVLLGLLNTETVRLPCPADLRRFGPGRALTVANMTGMYKISIDTGANCPFEATLSQVKSEMRTQKEKRRCYAGVRLLRRLHQKLPPRLVYWIVRKNYTLLPVSYTNLGVVDSRGLAFHGAALTDCYVTGTYRRPPDFQLCVSTFNNICTLNCTLLGGGGQVEQAHRILGSVRAEMRAWGLKLGSVECDDNFYTTFQ